MRKYSVVAWLVVALLVSSALRGQRFDHASPPARITKRLQQVTEPAPVGQAGVLILGFMGGRDSWNDARVGVGRLAKNLREMDLPGVQVATIENTKRRTALELVRRALDRNRDGKLDTHERESARLILYGQSFGGAAVVKFAWELKRLGIPVMLTVQVDSVGRDDAVIPSNVAIAANFFQHDGLFIHGRAPIRAEDAGKTEIVGNFQYSYRDRTVSIAGVPWYKKAFRVAHTRMDHDPAVWGKVEELILSALPQDQPSGGQAARWLPF